MPPTPCTHEGIGGTTGPAHDGACAENPVRRVAGCRGRSWPQGRKSRWFWGSTRLALGLQGLHRGDGGGHGLVDRNLTMQADQADDLGHSLVECCQRQCTVGVTDGAVGVDDDVESAGIHEVQSGQVQDQPRPVVIDRNLYVFPEVIGGRDVEFTLDRDDHAAVLHPRAQSKPVHVHSSRPHVVMVRGPFASPYADRRTPPTCSDTTPTEPDRGKMQMTRPRGLVDRWTLTV